MKSYKYTILVFVLFFLRSSPADGQFHLDIQGYGMIPVSHLAKGYKTSFEAGLRFSRVFYEKHRFFVHPSVFYVPKDRVEDAYLRYQPNTLWGMPVRVGYGYFITKHFSPSIAVGPVFFYKPDRVVGFTAALNIEYEWHRFILSAGMQRIIYNGRLDSFKFGLGYELF